MWRKNQRGRKRANKNKKIPSIIRHFEIEEMAERAQDTRNVLMRLEEVNIPFQFYPVSPVFLGATENTGKEGQFTDIPSTVKA